MAAALQASVAQSVADVQTELQPFLFWVWGLIWWLWPGACVTACMHGTGGKCTVLCAEASSPLLATGSAT
jgi:hypothetical protein